jgi:hypothetical protein
MNIKDFQSSISSKGVLQTNRFVCSFLVPSYLRPNGAFDPEQHQLISLRCESATFPGMALTTLDQPRLGYGPLEYMPHNAVLDDVTLTFLVDAFGDMHKLFYEWVNTIVNIQGSRGQSSLNVTTRYGSGGSAAPFEVGYRDNYKTDVEIKVFDKYAEEREVMKVILFNAYPKVLPSISLAWASNDELIRLSVPFTYTDFSVEYKETGSTFTAGVKQPQSQPNFQSQGDLSKTLAADNSPLPQPSPTAPLDVNPVTGRIERTPLNVFIKRG